MEIVTDETVLASVRALQEHGTQDKAAAELGVSQSTISKRVKIAIERGLYHPPGGSIEPFETKVAGLPGRGKRRVYYLTSAQNHTRLHKEAWANLLALVEEDDAELLVSCFKYDKGALGQRATAKINTFATREDELLAEYPHEIIEYVCDDRVDIAPNLTFCGELNVLPTAVNPLEGLENYTYRRSTIVPHPKIEMRSIPTMPGEGVKLMYTTGCVTQRNYIKRKVGFKAEHFHTYGALIVEVDEYGSWWCRQVTQGPDGSMHDLNRRAVDGVVYMMDGDDRFVEDICWGDIHADKLDEEVARASFGHQPESMLETLRPRSQHVHDLLDFSGRSHHTRRDPHQVFESHLRGRWELTQELKHTANVLWNQIGRQWCQTYVVNSNHDRHLERWLKEVDWRYDPVNAKMILALNLTILQAIEAGRKYNMTECALMLGWDRIESDPCKIKFLAEDESHVILQKIEGGIECGLHGDRGSNGAKGSLETFAKIDRKTNSADKHFAGIKNHAYQCGLTGRLNMGYNHGLSSWTNAHIVTYANGTRAIVSVWKGKWRA